ncbi:MAG: menaquinone biosynthesis protein, partial [Candidatus Subteraquimicrobiales bacterium]|nr:menaquinone biosynthesis protein [Candidatus Subteraquimicrobiales bacterium]
RELYLLPELTVSSDDEVKSILLVSKVPLEKLNNKKVALANTSATSQILARIILKEKYKVTPEYFTCPPNLPEMLLEAEACLLIGDDALRALFNPQGLAVFDLGKEWKDLTKHKMVYAVWATRKEFVKTHPELAKEVYNSLRSSMKYSLKNLEKISFDVSRWEVFTPDFLKEYFLSLKFSFDEEYQRGLIYFLTKAKEYGFLDSVPSLKFVEV